MIFDSGKRRFKRKQNIFCVDNSVFTWVLILWYEQKKKNTTRGGVIKNISADILSIVTQR
ncbi:hypothetical protein ECP030481614_1195 [Escherichia coli P0304816.14]|nr:hypothetical protein ECP030481614_1195 [Escherichia coli P0304816.14]